MICFFKNWLQINKFENCMYHQENLDNLYSSFYKLIK